MLKIDLHIHSQSSGHAYGTIYEIIKEAKEKKMQMIAITDHGPSMIGSAEIIHFKMGPRAPKHDGDLQILWGCEANLINEEGDLDLDEKCLERLDVVLAGLHKFNQYKDLGKQRNTKALCKALKNPRIKILSHPTNMQYEYDLKKVIECAIENNVLIELNLAYLKIFGNDKLPQFKQMIDIVKSKDKKVIVNSDAHFLHEIGDDAILKEYWDKLDLTNEMIINNYPDELKKFLGI